MKTVIPIEIVTLGDDKSFHLLVVANIDGKKYDLLIDTGASHSIFDATLFPVLDKDKLAGLKIESAGIHSGELNSSFGTIKKFRLGKLKYNDLTVILIDLTHVNELYKRFTKKRVAGLIGSDFLLEHKALIDYKNLELVLKKRSNKSKLL